MDGSDTRNTNYDRNKEKRENQVQSHHHRRSTLQTALRQGGVVQCSLHSHKPVRLVPMAIDWHTQRKEGTHSGES